VFAVVIVNMRRAKNLIEIKHAYEVRRRKDHRDFDQIALRGFNDILAKFSSSCCGCSMGSDNAALENRAGL
jgi:hypothetical protein